MEKRKQSWPETDLAAGEEWEEKGRGQAGELRVNERRDASRARFALLIPSLDREPIRPVEP